jgi:pimeloyl-ACP methyl ester carboxylesterase
VGDLRIAYEASGSGQPAVIFVHGFAADRTYFGPQVAHFAGRRRLVAVDLRGHGGSSPTDEATIDDFVADVVAAADAAGLTSTVICGHSMAGVVGLKAARLRPELVRGVAMIDGTVLFPEEIRARARTSLVPALASERAQEALRGYFQTAILGPTDPPDLTARVLNAVDRVSPALAHAVFASLMGSDYASDLQGAQCPLLYVHAKAPIDLQRLRELRPDALIGRVDGAGHFPMLTAPDEVNALLDGFLEVVEAEAA